MCLIMKHCHRIKHGMPTKRLVNCCIGDTVKIWCNSILYILRGNPLMGEYSLRWSGEHTLIYRVTRGGGMASAWGEIN